MKKKESNHASEPTTMRITDCSFASVPPAIVAAHLKRSPKTICGRVLKIVLILGAVGALAAGALFWGAIRAMDGKTIHEKHISSVDWLPKEAHDVTYITRNGLFWYRSYECTISTKPFLEFAKRQGWNLTTVNDYSTGLRLDLGLPPVRTVNGIPMDYYPEALVYDDRKPNGGGITVIFDTAKERLFVNESTN